MYASLLIPREYLPDKKNFHFLGTLKKKVLRKLNETTVVSLSKLSDLTLVCCVNSLQLLGIYVEGKGQEKKYISSHR